MINHRLAVAVAVVAEVEADLAVALESAQVAEVMVLESVQELVPVSERAVAALAQGSVQALVPAVGRPPMQPRPQH